MSLLNHELIHLLLTSLVVVIVCMWYQKRKLGKTNVFKLNTDRSASPVDRQLLITNYWLLITIILLFGIFLDVDHLFDYFQWSKGAFALKDFLNPSLYVHLSGKVYIPFHGFDLGIILWLVSQWIERKFKIKGLSLALTLSYFVHLLFDNFSFSHHPFAYFFLHRILNNFGVSSFDGF